MLISRGIARWLYLNKRPNSLAMMLNKAWSIVASLGVAPNYLETLEIPGRKSGNIISLPVVIAIVEEHRYLVSMLGENVQWVRNLRANGGAALLRSRGCEEIQLEEVPVEKRAPILKEYLRRAPGARPHLPVDKDAPLTEFEAIAAEFPVFRVSATSQIQ